MRQDDRAPFERALRRAREAAYAPGEFAGQESFMTATEIRALAARAGIGTGTSVLDLCCGVGGPGRLIARELGCAYLGVDASASAVAIARERASGTPCRFAVARVPPLPAGSFDVVLLLETMLAFEDKDTLLREVAAALAPGGRFAFTLEEGPPLTEDERAAMPDADTVWLTPLDELTASLERAGLAVRCQQDHSRAHRATAQALLDAFTADADLIAAQIGPRALADLLAAHGLWIRWLDEQRVRKLALVVTTQQASVSHAADRVAERRRTLDRGAIMPQTKADRQEAAKKAAATRERNRTREESKERGTKAAATRQGNAAAASVDQAKQSARSAGGGLKSAVKSIGEAARQAGKSASTRSKAGNKR